MLQPGDAAPPFALPDDTGEVRSLAELLRGGPLVLYFYPADFTPVCTAEACAFRDAASELAAAGVRVVGVSPQGVESKARFKAKHRLTFTLLADADGSVAKAYRARGWFGVLPFGTRRVTYVVSTDGRIAAAHASGMSARSHEVFAREALRTLSAG